MLKSDRDQQHPVAPSNGQSRAESLSGRPFETSNGGKFAPGDEASGQLDKAEIEVLPLLPARLEATETVEPTVTHLNHRPPRWVPLWITRSRNGLSGRRCLGDVRDQTLIHGQLTTRRRVVPTVQQETALFLLYRSSNDDSIGGPAEHRAVMLIGTQPGVLHSPPSLAQWGFCYREKR
ncbi:hypothetical protein SAMN00790413_05976 [Deinococcus hopiensis KR-140]|uniref:Uncharacterized protein n=1 Tax=Deinococcus hopiensis KR-140 TaxID=695939 RepID=A0A1W1VW46_9DEIO|nr:hypothetical protein SAMN00790413_05976 [Deinococcus hopiensis KR-140]